MPDSLLDELCSWLRIPSISSGDGDPADLERAAGWVCERIEEAGGTRGGRADCGQPAGRRRAALGSRRRADRPDLRALRRPEPVARERVAVAARSSPRSATAACTRGAPPTTRATSCRSCTSPADSRARASCPCTCGSSSRARRRSAATTCSTGSRRTSAAPTARSCSTAGMEDERTPALTIGVRGIVQWAVDVRTAPRNLHSGLYGGAALNAGHALLQALAPLMPGHDGLLRERAARRTQRADGRRAGILGEARPGRDGCSRRSARRELAPNAAHDFYGRTWAEPSFDINGFASGDAAQRPHDPSGHGARRDLAAPRARDRTPRRSARRPSG